MDPATHQLQKTVYLARRNLNPRDPSDYYEIITSSEPKDVLDETAPAACQLTPFFFFQAEDGIRDLTVTGVQTCALPIWQRPDRTRAGRRATASASSGLSRQTRPTTAIRTPGRSGRCRVIWRAVSSRTATLHSATGRDRKSVV